MIKKQKINKNMLFKEESLLGKITEAIMFSESMEIAFDLIAKHLADIFEVDRVYIVRASHEKLKKVTLIGGYGFEKLKYAIETEYDKRIEGYWNTVMLEHFQFLAIDNLSESKVPDFFKEAYGKIGTKSLLAARINDKSEHWGGITLEQTSHNRKWSNLDKKLIRLAADHISLAVKQFNLITQNKKQAEREKLFNEITNAIRESLNPTEIKTKVVNQIGKAFNADICIIHEFNKKNNKFLIVDEFSEYKSSLDILSYVGIDIENDKNLFYFNHLFKSIKEIIAPDWDKYIDNLKELTTEDKQYISKFGIKSNYVFPVTYMNNLYAVLHLTFTSQQTDFSEDEIKSLQILVNQVGIALHQAMLYKEAKENARREKLLRKLITIIKSDLEIKEALHLINRIIAKFYNVQRTAIKDFKKLIKEQLLIAEFKTDGINTPEESCLDNQLIQYWNEFLTGKEKVIVFDDIANSVIPEDFKQAYSKIGVKSIIGAPLKTNNNNWGGLFLYDYKKPRKWSEDDINFLEIIAHHISIAIRERNVYNQAKLLSNISHELKTPLAIINSYVEALIYQDKDKSAMTEKFIKIIKNNVDRTTDIIDNLLYLSSLESNSKDNLILCIQADLREILEKSIETCNERAKLKNIKIELIDNKLIKCNIHTVLMQQAVINLINNAINYSDNNTKVKVEAIKTDNEILINVSDSGCGIKEEDISNIFQRFYRADKSRSRKMGGSGLGLSIVKTIAEVHGGKVSVDSVYGKGSTFTIHLPDKI